MDITSYTSKGKKRNALLFPSEFREGLLVSIKNINGNFFMEFIDCLWRKGLENTLGLERI
jgi:hypothetical protein